MLRPASIVRAAMRSRLFTPTLVRSSIALTHTQLKSADSFESLRDLLQNQERDKLMLIDFFALWCPPCRLALSALERLAIEFPQVDIVSVDIDEVPRVVADFGVNAVPKTIFVRNGERVGVITGPSLKQLRSRTQELLQPESNES